MSSDREALLRAIAAEPGDDTPRLAYPDWLDEHASDLPAGEYAARRAEFIRAHIRAARSPEDLGRVSATSLLAVYELDWFGVLPARRESPRPQPGTQSYYPLPPPMPVHCPVERGFVTSVGVGDAVPGWLPAVARIVAAEPIGTLSVSVGDGGVAAGALIAALGDWPAAGRLRNLDLHTELTPDAAASLGECRTLTSLRGLYVQPRTTEAVDALSAGPLVEQLTRLTFRTDRPFFGGGQTNTAMAVAFAHLVNRTRVAELKLGNLADEEAAAFLPLVTAPQVTAIAAHELGFRDAVLPGFAACPVLPRVESLDLRTNYWSAPALARFFRSAPLESLRVLRASHCITYHRERGDEVWRAILAAPFAAKLIALEVGWRPGLVGQDLEPVAAGHFPALRVLSVGPAQVGDAGVERLARGGHARHLKELNLWDCGVTDRGAGFIAAGFPALERVNLRNNPVGDAGRAALAARFGERALL